MNNYYTRAPSACFNSRVREATAGIADALQAAMFGCAGNVANHHRTRGRSLR